MGKFRSVVFYRNHGYMSGGTIHHPHSQIVGFKDYDYHQDIKPFHFVGPAIVEEDGLTVNLSQRPIIGFYEVNLILKDRESWGNSSAICSGRQIISCTPLSASTTVIISSSMTSRLTMPCMSKLSRAS